VLPKIEEAVTYIKKFFDCSCNLGIILGSGLGAFADQMNSARAIPFSQIPHFPVSSVKGHAGDLILGRLGDHSIALMRGRSHYYEGYSPEELIFPVRVLHRLGIATLLVSNAAGGINTQFKPGDLMLVRDHINFMGFNVLRGKTAKLFGPQFPDMSEAYSSELRAVAHKAAVYVGITLQEGVYMAIGGPSYETPAEIRMFSRWGVDAVGMSTVPEVTAAVQMGIQTLCISCITNMAAGIQKQPLSHEEVIETSTGAGKDFVALLTKIVELLPK